MNAACRLSDAFLQRLRELGYKEGRSTEIVYRSSDGRDERFPGLASELVRLTIRVAPG
jgi:putative tryptophan/tyrosine transport system substrate-binding protein